MPGWKQYCIRRPPYNNPLNQISAIYLLESVWGLGLGRDLLENVMFRAAERSFSEVTLWVLRTNLRASRFYARAGFELDGGEKTETNPEGIVFDEVRYRVDVNLHAA